MSTLILDTFPDSPLNAAWTRRNIVTGDETWLVPGLTTAGMAAGDMYLRDAPAATAWTVEVKLSKSSNGSVMLGPVILDASGNGVGATFYNSPVGFLRTTITAYGYGSSFTNVNSSANLNTTTRMRIRRAGTNYFLSYSTDDGATWTTEPATGFSSAITVAKVGFGCWLNAAGAVSMTTAEFKVFDNVWTSAATWLDGTVGPPPVDIAGEPWTAPATFLDGAVQVLLDTDTSNALGGFRLGGHVINEAPDPIDEPIPPAIWTPARRDDIALYLPPPTIVDGRVQ